MKTCTRCNKTLSEDQFFNDRRYPETGKLRAECKQCNYETKNKYRKTEKGRKSHAKWMRERRREAKQWLLGLIGNQCSRCGESHLACLDFHHLSGKKFNISIKIGQMMFTQRELLLEEAKKCEILCANCHRKEHWID